MEKEVGERIVSISLFALKESLSRWAVLFSSTSLSLLAVVNWVGRGGGGGGGKRKVLKLLCQIEREREGETDRTEEGQSEHLRLLHHRRGHFS